MRFWFALLPLTLAACVAMQVAPAETDKGLSNPPAPPDGMCGAEDLQGLVGQPVAVLDSMRFSQTLRVIYPGMAVTMDYSAKRLNIQVGDDKTIIRVSCG